MNNKDKRILRKLQKNNATTLKLFLIAYCGIQDGNLLSNKLSHKDIKQLFPNLKRVSFDYVLDNIDDIYTGNIILVQDSFEKVVPYKNPHIQIYEDINIEYVEEDIENSNDTFDTVLELENLNSYELSQLAKKYKESNRITEYRKVCRMIKKRKNNGVEEYHKKKEKIIMKGRIENDEY